MRDSSLTRGLRHPPHGDPARSPRDHARAGRQRPAGARLEPLERRTLFNATLTGVQVINGLRTVNLTTSGNETLTINHDGNTGNLFIGTFSEQLAVDKLVVRCGSGVDNLTYNLFNTNLNRNFILDVNLGDGGDTFTINLNTDINSNRSLLATVQGSGGGDSIHVNADRDNNAGGLRVAPGGRCQLDLLGGANSDFVTMSYQGDLDGFFGGSILLDQFLDTGSDISSVRAIIDAGSSGSFSEHIEGGLTDDTIDFRVADNQGGRIARADVDAGFNFGDHDVVTHTSNVKVTNAEEEHIVNPPAFKNRTVASPTALGSPTQLSGIITEPDAGDTFFLDVNWGDGTPTETYTFLPGSFVSGVTVATVQHTYAHVGKYHISVLWRDQSGLSNEDNSLEAKVLPAPAVRHRHAGGDGSNQPAPVPADEVLDAAAGG